MLKVAITGNIASGKSQVEKYLLISGYKITDTDKINHYILMSDINVIKEIRTSFINDDILDEDGNISREKLGKIVFFDDSKKTKLEQILHKRIDERVEKFFDENKDQKVVFVSIPLLFETHQEKKFDKIIFISADEDIRLKRLMARNNFSEQYAKIRIASQGNETDKIQKSDYVIYNNTDFGNLKRQLVAVLNQIHNL